MVSYYINILIARIPTLDKSAKFLKSHTKKEKKVMGVDELSFCAILLKLKLSLWVVIGHCISLRMKGKGEVCKNKKTILGVSGFDEDFLVTSALSMTMSITKGYKMYYAHGTSGMFLNLRIDETGDGFLNIFCIHRSTWVTINVHKLAEMNNNLPQS